MPDHHLLAAAALLVLVAAAAVWDWRHWRIPDPMTGGIAVLGLGVAALGLSPMGLGPGLAAVSVVAAFLLFAGLRRLAAGVSAGATLGGGDVKLLAATAAWAGLPAVVVASMVASTLVLAIGIGRGMGRFDRMPFAPPFALAVCVVLALDPAF